MTAHRAAGLKSPFAKCDRSSRRKGHSRQGHSATSSRVRLSPASLMGVAPTRSLGDRENGQGATLSEQRLCSGDAIEQM